MESKSLERGGERQTERAQERYRIKLQIQDIQDVWRWIDVPFLGCMRSMAALEVTSSTGHPVCVERPGAVTDVQVVPHAHLEQRPAAPLHWHETPMASVLLLRCEQIEVYRSALKEHVDVFQQAVRRGSGVHPQAMVVYVTNVKAVRTDAQILKKRRVLYRKIHAALKSDFPKLLVYHLALHDPGVDQAAAFKDLVDGRLRGILGAGFDSRVAMYGDELTKMYANQHLPLWNACQYLLVKESYIQLHKDFNLLQEALRLYEELTFLLDSTDLRPLLTPTKDMPGPLLDTAGPVYVDRIYRSKVSEVELLRFLCAKRFQLFITLRQPVRAMECFTMFVNKVIQLLEGRRVHPVQKARSSPSNRPLRPPKQKKTSGKSILNSIRTALSRTSKDRDQSRAPRSPRRQQQQRRDSGGPGETVQMATFSSSKLTRQTEQPSTIPIHEQYAWILGALFDATDYITSSSSSSSSLAPAVRQALTVLQYALRVLSAKARERGVAFMRSPGDIQAVIADTGVFTPQKVPVVAVSGECKGIVSALGDCKSYLSRQQQLAAALDASEQDSAAFSGAYIELCEWGLSRLASCASGSSEGKGGRAVRMQCSQLCSQAGLVHMQRAEYEEARKSHMRAYECFVADQWMHLALVHLQWVAVCELQMGHMREFVSCAMRAMVLVHHYRREMDAHDLFIDVMFQRQTETESLQPETFHESEVVAVKHVVLLPGGVAEVTLVSRFSQTMVCEGRLFWAAEDQGGAKSEAAEEGGERVTVSLLASNEPQVVRLTHGASLQQLYALQHRAEPPTARLTLAFGRGLACCLSYSACAVDFDGSVQCQLLDEKGAASALYGPLSLSVLPSPTSSSSSSSSLGMKRVCVSLPEQLEFRDSQESSSTFHLSPAHHLKTWEAPLRCQLRFLLTRGTQAYIYVAVVLDSAKAPLHRVSLSRVRVDMHPCVQVKLAELSASLVQVLVRAQCPSCPVTITTAALAVPTGWTAQPWSNGNATVALERTVEHSFMYDISRGALSGDRCGVFTACGVLPGGRAFETRHTLVFQGDVHATGPAAEVSHDACDECEVVCVVEPQDRKERLGLRVDLDMGLAAWGQTYLVAVALPSPTVTGDAKEEASSSSWLLSGKCSVLVDVDRHGKASVSMGLISTRPVKAQPAECQPVVRVTHPASDAPVRVKVSYAAGNE
jgi:hypothetical protein